MGASLEGKVLSAHYTHKKIHNIVLFGEFTLTIASSYVGIFCFFDDSIYG